MIIHITAPSGTGKTTLVKKYKNDNLLKNSIIKDTDKLIYNKSTWEQLNQMEKLEPDPEKYKSEWDKFIQFYITKFVLKIQNKFGDKKNIILIGILDIQIQKKPYLPNMENICQNLKKIYFYVDPKIVAQRFISRSFEDYSKHLKSNIKHGEELHISPTKLLKMINIDEKFYTKNNYKILTEEQLEEYLKKIDNINSAE